MVKWIRSLIGQYSIIILSIHDSLLIRKVNVVALGKCALVGGKLLSCIDILCSCKQFSLKENVLTKCIHFMQINVECFSFI